MREFSPATYFYSYVPLMALRPNVLSEHAGSRHSLKPPLRTISVAFYGTRNVRDCATSWRSSAASITGVQLTTVVKTSAVSNKTGLSFLRGYFSCFSYTQFHSFRKLFDLWRTDKAEKVPLQQCTSFGFRSTELKLG